MRLLAALLLLLAPQVQADRAPGDAGDWLDRMTHAMRNLNYEGTFVYLHDARLEAMRIVHARTEEGEQERLLSLNGEPREILRDDRHLTCIWPGSRSVVVDTTRQATALPAWIPDRRDELERHYRFELGERYRIAGFPAQEVLIHPADGFRYGYHLWLERETGMLLKSDMLDERGEPVEQVMFTDLRFTDDPGELDLLPRVSTRDYRWTRREAEPEPLHERSAWVIERLPPGFRVESSHHWPGGSGKPATQQLVISDGLASVSVFIEEIDEEGAQLQGGSRMGAVNAYGRVVNGHHVTAVGEVPAATVELIGGSARYRSPVAGYD